MEFKEKQAIEAFALRIRMAALEAIHSIGSGHVGGVMSISDALAVLYGLIDGDMAQALMRRVVTEETLDGGTVFDIQPYFMHYVLEAVRKVGLFGEHGLRLLHLWDKQVEESPKGMKEGWGEFRGDCSHAWGATPTYQLPMAFSGFEMLESGFKKFRLAPSLWGLECASLAIPTPYGLIKIDQRVGEDAEISVPDAFEAIGGGMYRMRAD